MQKTKRIYLIVGKSGSGKTTLVNELRKYGYTSVESYTTRPKRFKNETGHIFITEEEFDQLKDICAYVKYNGYRYCATSEQVNNSTLYVIDPDGIEYFKKHYTGHKKICILYIDCPWYTRLHRMLKRGDSFKEAINRIILDSKVFAHCESKVNFIIVNKNKRRAVNLLKSVISELEHYGEQNADFT